ncbi:MAG: hypothetical protein COB09_18450 [Thalassobium sp.]|nr:MAG: hypothetical protein COB09_18450 [Thalassobium sp.]
MNKVIERLKEPSSWAGLAILALVALQIIPAEQGIMLLDVANSGGLTAIAEVAQPAAEVLAPVAQETNWLKIGLNVLGIASGVGALGSMILPEGRKVVLALLMLPTMLLFSGTATTVEAATFSTLSWELPTERINGKPLAGNEIGGILIHTTHPDGTITVYDETDGSATEYIFTPTVNGVYRFTVQVYDKTEPNVVRGIMSKPVAGLYDEGVSPPAQMPLTIRVTCDVVTNCDFEILNE